ncbi:MAG: N-carbamoylputrescine amidase [Clostridia bacterium]|nr:N-carbamoylputrescine amidase [Clostridia bacterium]
MRNVVVAAIQMSCSTETEENIENAEKLIREAASRGGQIILIQELFENIYFCQDIDDDYFELAHEVENHPMLNSMSSLAKELNVVLPISFFEKANKVYFNSLMVIDADGSQLGVYRKTHIPDNPGYYEKYYFSPGNTGFKVWDTKYAKIGIGICWDQWFPESARCMALMGAEMLFYPTAIGSEPSNPQEDTSFHWQMCMRGHAASNVMPVIAANRIGTEKGKMTEISFYGKSFIAGNQGNIIAEADLREETIILAEFDLDQLERERQESVLFRDRRPEHYKTILTLDGRSK